MQTWAVGKLLVELFTSLRMWSLTFLIFCKRLDANAGCSYSLEPSTGVYADDPFVYAEASVTPC